MKDRRQDTTRPMRPFRFAVFALAALVVLSLGFALIPAEKPAPAEPPFSEQARAAAFNEAVDLRAAGMRLASTGALDSTALEEVVTLLTIHARALQSPATASATPTPSAAGSPSGSWPPSSPAGPRSSAELVQAIAASGSARLKDAETADGGMARLLAGAGTAQLLAAGRLAGAAGVPAPQWTAGADGEAPGAAATASECPSPSPAYSSPEPFGPGTPAGVRQVLAAVVATEQQAVYGYQAALPRVAPAEAGPASDFLDRHRDLAAAAEEHLRLACGSPVPQQPGYVLDAGFLASPAAGLGRLEAATLTAFADVVAVCQGQDRRWALSGLQSAAARASHWGADVGPVPGLTLDVDQLPDLPGSAGSPAPPVVTPSPAGS